MMRAAYRNSFIRAELDESTKGTNVLEDAGAIITSLKENGISAGEATAYVNDNFLDYLSEFISGGIVCRTIKEIGSTPEYYQSQERQASNETETTFTLMKKLSVDVGKIYPYIDVTIRAGLVELKKTRFPFKLSGKVTLSNPRITVYKGKIVRAALGTMTPSFSIYYTGGGKERLIHTFDKPVKFDEIDFTCTAPGREKDAGPAMAVS
jgi:hypothetical protein